MDADKASGHPIAQRRESVYIWVTWLAPLMAGSAHCEWAAWFRAHHTYEKPPFNDPQLITDHNEMVLRRKEELKGDGFAVLIERQNKFSVTSRATGITIGAQPDIVATKNGLHVVEDCKSRGERESHYWQVLMYMLLLPSARPNFKEKTFHGRLIYRDSERSIDATCLTQQVRELFKAKVAIVGGDKPPDKVPSPGECRWCDISSVYCDERIEEDTVAGIDDTDLF